ncbi:PAS domain S-box protein [Salarchaeum sp. JOR-1]|uniref:PAS domain S-box protein n=1 Tax=Salarchaeum sp. JOR-1 TaxID=2599399 RepID=UPI0011986C81|nr:PAS domain S-box protein [Salarchaeum sp. JOR-1]QDX39413.1 PAS domain S-box protein [Salarchaeum sp. JOR-1]
MTDRDALPEPSALPRAQTIDILHVDDDASFCELVAAFLEREREHFTVHSETEPRAALERLADDELSVDCIVSDYDMPPLDGLTLLERVRDTHPDLPFILFTGKGSEEIASEAITAGVTDYLQKAGGTEQYSVLANRIQNAVEAVRAEQYMNRGLEAIETAQDGIGILDEDGYIEYVNSAWADILGYDREELLGVHWETLYQDDDVEHVYDVLLPEARHGRWHGTTSFVRKSGEEVTVEHTLSYTGDGSLVCTLTPPASDTEPASASLKERAMEEAPIGIVLTDPQQDDNPIVYANEEFTALTGYEERDVLGRNCRLLQGERTAEEPVAELRTAVENQESTTVELRNYRTDGTPFWNRVRIAPLFDDDGDLELFVGFQDDVTEQKQYEQQLQTQTARLEALFEHSPDMFAVHDINGVIRDVNQRLCDELGYTEDELVGRTVWDLDPSADPDRSSSFWETMPPNRPQRFEGELERSDGSTFPIEVHLIRLNLEGKDRFVAMDRDISEQKQRERELVQKNERLERFTSVVSHDLRNPLQVAAGHLDLLRDEYESAHIEKIGDALSRMDEMIEDLLALARAGEEAMETESVSLAAIARACWGAISTPDATLSVETERTIEADRDQLQQLVTNLLQNAVDHGGPDVAVTVGDTEAGFYVADDGDGFPNAEQSTLFEAGYTTAEDGTGFGLSIVEEVVDRHGWAVTATNGPAGGARFEIRTDDGRQ